MLRAVLFFIFFFARRRLLNSQFALSSEWTWEFKKVIVWANTCVPLASWRDGSAQISALIDIHRQHGKQCHESNQNKQLLSEATHNHIRLLRVDRLSSSFLFFFRFDILVDGYNSFR